MLALLTTWLILPDTAEAKDVPHRFSLEAGAGSLLYYYHARVAYRLPDIAEDRIGVFLDASFFEGSFSSGSSLNVVTAGARYFFDDWYEISPYAFAGVTGLISTSRGINGAIAGNREISPVLAGGVGADWMWTPHVGLNTQLGLIGGTINGQTSALPRVEVNLKLAI